MPVEYPILLWTIVGAASGIVMGLAGTGGGVISIPILMTLGGYDVKEASGYGLLALTVGATLTWLVQRKHTIYSITAVLVVFSGTMAFLTAPLKAISPHWIVTSFLNLTCLFSLYSLWTPRKPEDRGEISPFFYRLKTASIGGIITGFLSTMTGLGGGVVIIPWLTSITRIRFENAMACSLLTIAITAPISAWRQKTVDLALQEWIALIISILVVSFITKKLLTHLPSAQLILVRKLTLTGVIFTAMIRTLSVLM